MRFCVYYESPPNQPGVQRCWPRAPAEFSGIGVGVWMTASLRAPWAVGFDSDCVVVPAVVEPSWFSVSHRGIDSATKWYIRT